MADIFLSYTRDDRFVMEVLRDNLRALGFNVWIDEESLPIGTPDWWRAIENAVRHVDAMVVVMSPEAKSSEWVNNEIALALKHNVKIFPVLAYGDDLDAVPPPLVRYQYADVGGRADYETEFRKLAEGLGKHTGHAIEKYTVLEEDERRVVRVDVSGHVEGSVVVVGRDVERDVKVAGRDVVEAASFDHVSPEETVPSRRVVDPERIPAPAEPIARSRRRVRPVVIGAGALVALGVVGVGVVIGILALAFVFRGPADESAGMSEPVSRATATLAEVAREPTDEPSEEPATATISQAGPLKPTPAPIPLGSSGNPVTANDQWTPIIQDFDGVEMALVPAGCFDMGSDDGDEDETPVHEQCFEEPFWIDVYEVSNAQYGSASEDCLDWSSTDDQPRVCVSWFEAVAHCESRGARLPTEAEWEYAARGPDGLDYPWGNEFDGANLVYAANAGSETAEVGSRPEGVSWVGAHDLSGNVWEWLSTIFADYPYDALDGREVDGSNDGSSDRAQRGSSWLESGTYEMRAAYREGDYPGDRYEDDGFRCARSF